MNEIKVDKIIIGLGNYGAKYENTRHNIGYTIISNLIKKYNGTLKKIPVVANYSIINIKRNNILCVLPLTYMNESGKAATYFLNKFHIEASNMLIIVDEYNFPVGKIHLKKINSDGGHNGVHSVLKETQANEFYILRCGIDKNFGNNELVDYVLSNFAESEMNDVNAMLTNAITAIEFYLHNEISKAMSYINSKQIFNNGL